MTIQNISQQFVRRVEQALLDSGVIFRIFSRCKSEQSIVNKISRSPDKYGENKKIQDIIGIRVALYFLDDIEIAKSILCQKFEHLEKHSTIDKPDSDEFKATRYNLIFKLPESFKITSLLENPISELVDDTCEIQIRTILSEGWHEVEHDLRYKAKKDWKELSRESRALNGVYATIETCEWTLLKIFEDISYKHYKNSYWEAMIQNKFRLRFSSTTIPENLKEILDNHPEISKSIFRASRMKLIEAINQRSSIPITTENIIYVANRLTENSIEIINLEPKLFAPWWTQDQLEQLT